MAVKLTLDPSSTISLSITHRPLSTLRYSSSRPIHLGLKHVDFWSTASDERAVTVFGTRVFFAGTCTSRKTLSGKVRNGSFTVWRLLIRCSRLTVKGLVCDSADITGIIAVRPLALRQLGQNSIKAGTPTIPSNVAPYPTRPKFPRVQIAGQRPDTLLLPGNETLAWIRPPVKQNLFHVASIPPM